MSTPSIQTLITQAQQVLNLKSSNEIRATLAAVLANANVGTPLNPNLTTQQLWDEFYEIVRQPSDDIMSIITDQMMRMVFSPPAPGGAGADKQVIFNDGGVLAGDSKFLWDKTANRLDVDGPVVITGALTVDTTTLVANAAGYADRVGIGTATPIDKLQITSALATTGTGIVSANGLTFQNTDTTVNNYTAIQNRDSSGSQNAQIQFVNVTQGGLFQGAIAFTTRVSAGDFAERARFNPTGNLAFASGKGIDFSAVTGGTGTATANVLNDYEEGTWTGTLNGGTTNPTVPVTATGKYTKVGRQVTVAIYFFNVSTVGASGSVNVIGLPFTEDGTRAVGTVSFFNFDFNGGTGPFVDVSGATMFFQSQLTNSNWRDVNHSAGVGRYLRATLTYFV